MLKLARLTQSASADITFGEYVPFAIEWPAHRSPDPWYWRIAGDYELLMIGLDPANGALASVENPASLRVVRSDEVLWRKAPLKEGHPVVEMRGLPTDETYFDAPDVTTFEFRHSPRSIKLTWGSDVTVVGDGRCRFGFDAESSLVAIGLDGLTAEEARIVDEVVAHSAANRGRPVRL